MMIMDLREVGMVTGEENESNIVQVKVVINDSHDGGGGGGGGGPQGGGDWWGEWIQHCSGEGCR